MSEEVIISLQNVGKQYRSRWALQDISLEMRRGEILGFIGPNGAGKTTLMRILSGLTTATTGTVQVFGQKLTQAIPPDGIGLLLEHIGFLPGASGRKNLELLASLRGRISKQEIDAVLNQVGLDPNDSRPVRAYSLGMRQRLGVAQALMEKPKLLLLDEPTNGLDPQGIVELRTLLKNLAEAGTSILLASHLLTELERLCHRVIFVKEGRLRKELSLVNEQPPIQIDVESDADRAWLETWAHQRLIPFKKEGDFRCYLYHSTPIADLLDEWVPQRVRIQAISRSLPSLEREYQNVFLKGESS